MAGSRAQGDKLIGGGGDVRASSGREKEEKGLFGWEKSVKEGERGTISR
jgi:hypothetical protein